MQITPLSRTGINMIITNTKITLLTQDTILITGIIIFKKTVTSFKVKEHMITKNAKQS